nr:hypothetical protein [Tanacetum cinerariifolium]
MSSPNHPTFDIEYTFSSNSPNYTSASPDYSPASPGNTSSDSSNNSYGLVPIASPTLSLFLDDPYMKVMHAYDTIMPPQIPIPPPTIVPSSPMLSPIFKTSFFLRKYFHQRNKAMNDHPPILLPYLKHLRWEKVLDMSTDVARGHDGDGGGDDSPPPYQVPTGCGGCLGNQGKGTRKPNLGGRREGRLHTRQETQNLELKSSTDKSGPVPIWFEVDDRETLMPLGDHAHIQKIYNGKKAALKQRYWVPEEDGSYDLEGIRRTRPSHISEADWNAQLAFWNDPKNLARAAQNKQNRAKSKV